MSLRDHQLRPLGQVRLHRQRRRRAWLALGFAIALTLTILSARELLG